MLNKRFRQPVQAEPGGAAGDAVWPTPRSVAAGAALAFTVGPMACRCGRAPVWVTVAAGGCCGREKSAGILRVGEARRTPAAAGACAHRLARWHCSGLPGALRVVPIRRRALLGAARGWAERQLHIGSAVHGAAGGRSGRCRAGLADAQPRQHFIGRLTTLPRCCRCAGPVCACPAPRHAGAKRPCGRFLICLNWRLLHYPPAIVDYVVAHELAHLRVMDHSPRFWDTAHRGARPCARRRHPQDEPPPQWH